MKTKLALLQYSLCLALLGKVLAMAAGNDMQDLCAELTCPICLDYFKDPITIAECGHNFCQACLTQCCRDLEGEAPCPQCRRPFQQKGLIANRQLSNVVEIAKNLQEGRGRESKERVCEKHQEPLKLFCKEDALLICVVCDKTKEHRAHEVIPLEEAPHDYKEKTASYLMSLKKLQAEMCMCVTETYKESEDLLEQTEADREKTVFEFQQLHKFLEEQEKLLLAQIEEVEKEIKRRRCEHVVKLSRELSSLESLIQEVEKKCLQPASEFLQDIKSTLQRCEAKKEYKKPVVFPVDLKWRIWDLWDLNPFLEGVIKQFRDKLVSGLMLQKANVTLDPDTAFPFLNLSPGCRGVKMGRHGRIQPSNPERFDGYAIVLGREGFISGRHFWEVLVENEGDWEIGVAKKSVERKTRFVFGPEKGFWTMGKHGNKCQIYGSPKPSDLSLSRDLKRIRVDLNYEGGQVAFFDPDSAALLFTYSAISFSGETILPLFWVLGKTYFRLSP